MERFDRPLAEFCVVGHGFERLGVVKIAEDEMQCGCIGVADFAATEIRNDAEDVKGLISIY